jgi:hypothetical protein
MAVRVVKVQYLLLAYFYSPVIDLGLRYYYTPPPVPKSIYDVLQYSLDE